MEIKKNKFGKYECPCCGFFTLSGTPDNSFDICPVCCWEADGVQFENPQYSGGANAVSLEQARYNFTVFGASDRMFTKHVRRPLPEEMP